MSNNTVRIILKKFHTGGRGDLLLEEYKTVEISSEEIEKLLVGDDFSIPFSVVGAELINTEYSKEKYRYDWLKTEK